jgi:glycerol-3-phosphate dehydrogenase
VKRNLEKLADKKFDLVIIGGGIFGACAAWDAALRGLSVALIERDDFCSGTSANSFKIVHGGIRYVQHLDIVRVRASCRERSALLRIAPHLVHPLPILIPTYGHGREGKGLLGAGMLMYDLLTQDRNRGIRDAHRRIPPTRFFSRREILEHYPDLAHPRLTGGALFCDGQIYNPPRLVLAFIRSAAQLGAEAANYIQATDLIRLNDRVSGIRVRDALTGDRFSIYGRVVLNATGPWAEHLLAKFSNTARLPGKTTYSRDACFGISRSFGPYALAVQGRTHDPDAVLSRPARHLFIVPWREYALVGVWHKVYRGSPDHVSVALDDLKGFVEEFNWAFPSFDLKLSDVTMCNTGLVPCGDNEEDAKALSYGKRSHLFDHARNGLEGLITLIGVRYTMARGEAVKAVDLVCRKLGRALSRPLTHRLPLYGGDIEDFDSFLTRGAQTSGLPDRVAHALLRNHGTRYCNVLNLARQDATLAQTFDNTTVLKAEAVHAVREEMGVRLDDVVFRRTDLGTARAPTEGVLRECASIVARESGWSASRTAEELDMVKQRLLRLALREPLPEVRRLDPNSVSRYPDASK